ncbi:MAG: thioredoxin family protein [Bacteroidaceae bacterium]|nr:thioredoxin family protein [Bacteroidaceae bacterium]
MRKLSRHLLLTACMLIGLCGSVSAIQTSQIVTARHNASVSINELTSEQELNITVAFQFLEKNWHLNGENTSSHFVIDSINGLEYKDEQDYSLSLSITNRESWYISGYCTYSVCNAVQCLLPEKEHFIISSDNINSFSQENNASDNNTNRILLFIISLGAGLLAVLTPCVWPLIPTVISLFSRKKGGLTPAAASLLFGGSIVIIYDVLGIVLTAIFGPATLNALSTNAAFNIIFFIIFVLFALSMFGLFELRLPNNWGNSTNKLARNSALWSIFFMALTIVIVSFSCTSPIVGGLLVESSRGGFLNAGIGMTGFAIGLSAPFTLFALFPEWLEKRPKSGLWMEKIKVCIGFVELAFSLKFLSVADLAYGWGILPRKLFISIWIVLAISMGLYLAGLFSKKQKPGRSSIIGAAISFILAAAMIPGYFGAPLKAISAFLPAEPLSDMLEPHFYSYFAALDAADKEKKNVLIYFTGYGCVNCRKMEATLWTDRNVKKEIEDYFILTALHVDDKSDDNLFGYETNMLINFFNLDRDDIRSWGDLWSQFQSIRFNANAQPYYIIVNKQGRIVSQPYAGYKPQASKFVSWLKENR